MSIFNGLNISASALTMNRFRMDVVSSNMANADSTRAKLVNGEWQPYRRKMVEIKPQEGQFQSMLNQAIAGKDANLKGVKVSRIVEDETPFKMVYNPEHPDANDDGFVQMPNVDPLKEMVDLMSATRSYEANVTAFNATKGMLMKSLEIGK